MLLQTPNRIGSSKDFEIRYILEVERICTFHLSGAPTTPLISGGAINTLQPIIYELKVIRKYTYNIYRAYTNSKLS